MSIGWKYALTTGFAAAATAVVTATDDDMEEFTEKFLLFDEGFCCLLGKLAVILLSKVVTVFSKYLANFFFPLIVFPHIEYT